MYTQLYKYHIDMYTFINMRNFYIYRYILIYLKSKIISSKNCIEFIKFFK